MTKATSGSTTDDDRRRAAVVSPCRPLGDGSSVVEWSIGESSMESVGRP
jgi:hypothetical protein